MALKRSSVEESIVGNSTDAHWYSPVGCYRICYAACIFDHRSGVIGSGGQVSVRQKTSYFKYSVSLLSKRPRGVGRVPPASPVSRRAGVTQVSPVPPLPHTLQDSVSSRSPRWIQITTTAVEKRFGDSLERGDVPYSQKLTGLVLPYRATMDDILPADDGPDRRRSFTIHRGTFLLQEEELVEEAARPEVSPRRKFLQEVDPLTPGRENWTLSHSYLTPPEPTRNSPPPSRPCEFHNLET
ncbi:hypothetical protein J6590_011108 [Homalodisca vitripennis]|nr:hypothetical protein J6590_011108 [Homalodisca vitripennis]